MTGDNVLQEQIEVDKAPRRKLHPRGRMGVLRQCMAVQDIFIAD
jgi:hypothetical protein